MMLASAGGGKQSLELQVTKPERGDSGGTAVGGRSRPVSGQNVVDDACGRNRRPRQPSGDRRGL